MNNSLGIASLCRVIMRNACFLSRVSIPCFLHGDSMPSAPPLRARLPSGLAQKACPEGRRPPGQPKGTPKALPPWGALWVTPWMRLGVPWGCLGAPPRHPQGNSTTKDTNLRLIPPCPRKAAEALGSPRPGRRRGDPWKLRLRDITETHVTVAKNEIASPKRDRVVNFGNGFFSPRKVHISVLCEGSPFLRFSPKP